MYKYARDYPYGTSGVYYHGPMIRDIRIRGNTNGFGFSILHQNPCQVGFVTSGSAAEEAGLRPMDHIVSINGRNIRQLHHEDVVKELENSGNLLMLQIVDPNDQYNPVYGVCPGLPKPYVQAAQYNPNIYEPPSREPFHDGHWKVGRHVQQSRSNRYSSRHLESNSRKEAKYAHNESDDERDSSFDQYYLPQKPKAPKVGLAKHKLRAHTRETQKTEHVTKKHDSRQLPKDASKRDLVKDQKPLTEKFNNALQQNDIPPSFGLPERTVSKNRKELPKEMRDKENQSTNSRSGVNQRKSKKADKQCIQEDVDDFEVMDVRDENSHWFVVSYVSSMDIPIDSVKVKSHVDAATIAAKRVRSLKNCEQIVLAFSTNYGIRLINRSQKLIGNYKLEHIKWCCSPLPSEDSRLFVIVIAPSDASRSSNVNHDVCHVFRIDPSIVQHSKHVALANVFGLECTRNFHRSCLEFPGSVEEIVSIVSSFLNRTGNIDNQQLRDNTLEPVAKELNSNSPSFKMSNNEKVGEVIDRKEHLRQEKIKFFSSQDQEPSPSPFKVPFPVSKSQNDRVSTPPVLPGRKLPPSNSQHAIQKPPMPSPLKLERIRNRSQFDEPGAIRPATSCSEIFTSTPCKSAFTRIQSSGVELSSMVTDSETPFERCDADILVTPVKKYEDSQILQKSTCSSLQAFLNDLAKTEKNNFNSKKLSLSSGAVDQFRIDRNVRGAQLWALNFDLLLNDEAGLATFMEFLDKEFSSENLLFWLKCRNFKKLFSPDLPLNGAEVKVMVKEIYQVHITESASNQVNIDWAVRKKVESRLDDESASLSDIFDVAHKHIHELMRQDKYPRFKESQLYLEALNDEKSGKPFKYSSFNLFKGSNTKKGIPEVDLQSSATNNDKRKSLLNFWKRKKSVRQSIDVVNPLQKLANSNSDISQGNVVGGSNLPPSSRSSAVSLNKPKGKDNNSYCKVILPHTGVVAKVPTGDQTTVAECLSKLGSNIDPGFPFLSPVDETGSTLHLSEQSSVLSDRTILLQRYGISRLDLPGSDNPLIIRYKPQVSLQEVLNPVLEGRGLIDEELVVCINKTYIPKKEWKVETMIFDCKRIIVEKVSTGTTCSEEKICELLKNLDNNKTKTSLSLLKDLFKDILPPAPKQASYAGFFSHLSFDENNISTLKGIDEWLSARRKSQKPKLFGFIRRSSVDKTKVSQSSLTNLNENEIKKPIRHSLDPTMHIHSNQTTPAVPSFKDGEKNLITLLSKAQNWTLEEQRGKCSAQHLTIPDFLREKDEEARRSEEAEICPDLFPQDNQFVIDRRLNEQKEENIEELDCPHAFDLRGSGWDDFFYAEDKETLFGNGLFLPSVEEADLIFNGGQSPPPLTIIERGAQLEE